MNVFIGGSSRDNIDYIFVKEAKKLATYLANNNYNLVSGSISGLMSYVNDIFISNNMNNMIMTVYSYQDIDINKDNVYNHNTIGDRKYSLINNSNLIAFLPGGLGTFDEIFTTIESKRAKEHNLPIIIININNYYDDLINQLNKMYNNNLADKKDSNYYHIANSVDDAIKYIEELGVSNDNK